MIKDIEERGDLFVVLLMMGIGAVRWWNRSQERGLNEASEQLDGVTASTPTAPDA